VKHQVLDKRSYNADEPRATLKKRASKSSSAEYWGSVDNITTEEEDIGERVRFDRTVVRCKQCGHVHGESTINPPNFALSHFSNHTTNPSYKKLLVVSDSMFC
jgi:hypothetical protein